MRRLLAAALAVLFTLACATPAIAAEGHVDLGVFATLDKQAYLASDLMTMTVTVVNSGTATATGVVVRPQGDLEFAPWGDLGGSGIELKPGAAVTVDVTAAPNDSGAGMTERLEAASAEPDHNPADNVTTVTSFVTVEKADLTVTLYGDADDDGVVDAGETRSGVLIMLSGGINPTDVAARTDAAGVARFPGIPGGEYVPFVNLPKGWYVDSQYIDVRAGTNTASIRAKVIDLSALSASVSLDRASYAPGDTIRERVTITNSGATDITGVVAHCGGWGVLENVLVSAGWGDLSSEGAGVAVPAGETRTWEFTDVVPAQAWDFGFVTLHCDFSPKEGDDGPVAEARAAVPGGVGGMSGRVVDIDHKVLAGVKILLMDPVSGVVAARVVSDGDGRVEFPSLAAGLYEVRPVGPWRLNEKAVSTLHIMAGQLIDFGAFILVPGPVQGDPDSPPPTGKSTVDVVPAPAPRASPRVRPSNLADTGADVVELAALGFLLTVAGALLLRARRV